MSTATIPTISTDHLTNPATAPSTSRTLFTARAGGIGGLVFAGTILLQNALRSGAPANDASPEKIISYYADHRGVAVALAVLFAFGVLGITTFVGSLVAQASGKARMPAAVGALAVGALLAMFGIVSATEFALSTYVHRGAPDPSVVSGLWLTHMSVFNVNLIFIAVALASLTAASAAMGLISRKWNVVGPLGALALAVGAATTPAIVDGSPIFGVALAGFLVWAVFVVVTSISLLRRPATD